MFGEQKVCLELRGTGTAEVHLDSADGQILCSIKAADDSWKLYTAEIESVNGTHAIFVKIVSGRVDFASIGFE